LTSAAGRVRKVRQNLAWAVSYSSLAIPIAAGVFAPLGFSLDPAIRALAMSGSSIIVAVNALALKWLKLPGSAALRRIQLCS
jgi:Cu2+-exporting ATPase